MAQLNHHCFRFINIHYYTPKTKENKILTIIDLFTDAAAIFKEYYRMARGHEHISLRIFERFSGHFFLKFS